MWTTFIITFLTAAAVLIVPGGLFLLSSGMRPLKALCCAPALSAVVLCAEALLLSEAGVPASPVWFLAPPIMVSAFIAVLRALGRTALAHGSRGVAQAEASCTRRSTHVLGAYLLVGVVSVSFVFVKQLDGADSMFQAIDNFMHVGLVRSFVDSADLSFLHVTLYRDLGISGVSSVQGFTGGFYPAAWHIVTALAVMVTHAPITVAVNAMNAVVIGVVCPLASFYLMRELFPDKPRLVLAGALATMCISASPWDFVIFGPLYPNNLSNVMVPLVCGSFIACTRAVTEEGPRAAFGPAVLFVITSAGVALAHPSGIFMAAIFLTPYCVSVAHRIARDRFGQDSFKRFAAPAVVLIAVAGIWLLCYKSPFFAATVSFNWPARLTKHQALIDVLTLGMSGHSAQIIVAILMWAGLFSLARDRARRWLCAPFLFAALAYIVDVSTEGTLKHVLAGFWYTDPHRISAMAGAFAVPLVAAGAAAACECVLKRLSTASPFARSRPVATRALLVLVGCAAIFYPNYTLRGYGEISTGFGFVSSTVAEQNSVGAAKFLSKVEEDFCNRVLREIPKGSLLLNSPNDGSVYLYGLYGANIYYRDFLADKAHETPESALIREHLAEVGTNAEVQEAVRKIGARYLLVLDLKNQEYPTRSYSISYFPEEWAGIDAVNDDTPGFTPILSEGDMRLYRIDAVE